MCIFADVAEVIVSILAPLAKRCIFYSFYFGNNLSVGFK